MVSRHDVEQAFRLILGREPESAAVVEQFATTIGSIPELRQKFLDSDEFSRSAMAVSPAVPLKSAGWSPMHVDVDVGPEQLQAMLRHVERSWEALGNTELFWSVLTHDKYRASELEANLDSFYESGRTAVELFLRAVDRAGIVLGSGKTCLELGCGAGRITMWLAEHFQRVIACDISQPHIEAARTSLIEKGVANVDFVCTNTVAVLQELPTFDLFFSLIVLQHNPPPVAALILRTLLGKLNPGGIAYFQIPTHSVGYRFSASDYLADALEEMEMHAVPQKELFALFASTGCEVLEVREDDWTGSPNILSNSFLLRKSS